MHSGRYKHCGTLGQAIAPPSGRMLGYHSSGPATGTPVIYIHGHPDSGVTITRPRETHIASELNIRWIGPDRPGVGLSTPYDSQDILDYPADIQALAEHLRLPNYYILGTSGGTGFTLACAKDLPPSQLKGHPAEFTEYFQTEYVPLAQQDDAAALEKRIRSEFEESFTGEDRDVVPEENTFKMAVAAFRQAWVQGAWAHANGMEFHWRPWGFMLEDVAFPAIRLWYGENDVITTPAMGKYMAERPEKSVYREYVGESHYTIWREKNLKEMVRDLLEIHG
ncbi:hypothetical protein DL764_001575 [Monosporascus ibericus]|uniref:AB hydrolase-1 domain-containing protein n=1 Tax=Monosporascus ibericus TaxID=155417 RepID=A0A4Q4TRF4_9PEZI|nr:hypothetical protein DL764_001575 [Monosporascus ibericus]